MSLSNMVVFNREIPGLTIEMLAQMIDKFNAASGGAIALTAEGFEGDFIERSFFQALHTAQRRVDRYASNAAASATDLQQVKEAGVKIAGGFGPILFEPSQMTWMLQNEVDAIRVISTNMAEAIMADMLNTLISSAAAAFQNQAGAFVDMTAVSPAQTVTHFNLNKMHALFGDHSSSIVAHVMRGSTAHKLLGQNITNDSRLFQYGNVQVIDILGRLTVVTDAPGLYVDNSPGNDDEIVLGLTAGALTAYDPGDMIVNIETSNGKERIETTLQADYTFGASIKGYTWDTTTGGKSPTDAELATGSNWDLTVSDLKHSAGVCLVGDATLDA